MRQTLIWVSHRNFEIEAQAPALRCGPENLMILSLKLNFYPSYALFKERVGQPPLTVVTNKSCCGADRDRTDDIQLAKLALSQLSYSPRKTFVGLGGLEPPTSRLSGVRSNQLSYRPSKTSARTLVMDKPCRTDSNAFGSKSKYNSPLQNQTASLFSSCEPLTLRNPARTPLLHPVESRRSNRATGLHRKEVIQPQVPLRLPCYDFTPVTKHSLGDCLLAVGTSTSGAFDSHGVTGGVYKARERIHRGVLIRDY